MKIKITLLVLILFSGVMFSQIINIPDAVFKDMLIAEGVDINNDGEIQESEALLITDLNVHPDNTDPKIENLEGIQYFTNLITLDCASNLLSSLNVSALTNLETLKAFFNQLESINIEDLNQLTFLWVSNNQLEVLDISTNINLEKLYCSNNLINNLDISLLQNLLTLRAGNNNLNEIDLLPLSNLTSIDVSSNNIFLIEVNHLLDLEGLGVANNFLSEINISNLQNLTDISVDSNFISELDCSNTNAIIISCSNNPDLFSINVQNNVISWSDPDLLYYGFSFNNLPSLKSICMDTGEEYALSVSGYNPDNVTIYTGPNCTLSVNEYSFNEAYIYPNPVSNNLYIKSTVEISNFSLYNISGKLLINTFEEDQLKSKTYSLTKGIYFLKLESVLGNQKTIKLIKN
ncbi:MAG: hypothetical protein COB12_07775 [Flavobacterium sp.]|nr:MAG: hypothetical protein COB12_07775 [Flavobacterium sp.]